jgi:hypothetical protein
VEHFLSITIHDKHGNPHVWNSMRKKKSLFYLTTCLWLSKVYESYSFYVHINKYM